MTDLHATILLLVSLGCIALGGLAFRGLDGLLWLYWERRR